MALPSNQRNGMHFNQRFPMFQRTSKKRLSTRKKGQPVATCLKSLIPLMQPTQWTVLATVK